MSIRSRGGVYGSGDSFRIDASEFAELLNDVKAFDKKLGNAIRKRVRDAGKPMVKKMQAAVTEPKSKRSARIVTVRTKRGKQVEERTNTSAAVARGIAFKIDTGRNPGGRFTASGKHLPEGRKPMFRALNKATFRHPVFGNRGQWANQAGRPYFGSVVLAEQDALRKAISEALDDAAATLGRSRIRR